MYFISFHYGLNTPGGVATLKAPAAIRIEPCTDHRPNSNGVDITFQRIITIIIHLLGLAPAGYSTASDNGAKRRLRVGACLSHEVTVVTMCH
jgi:hypothetical protein